MTLFEKQQITEWLYVNDGGYKDKVSWRKAFIGMLDSLKSCATCNRLDSEVPKKPDQWCSACADCGRFL